jgi:phage terminase small subunit
MPSLANYMHEIYARERAQGASRSEAALRAGYKDSPRIAVSAHKVEHTPGVRERIAELQIRIEDGIVEKKTATINGVLQEYGHIAFLDPGQAFDEGGNLLPIREMPETVRRAIAGIEFEDIWEGQGKDRAKVGRLAKLKFLNKIDALNSVGRNLGMFIERQTQELEIEKQGIRVTGNIPVRRAEICTDAMQIDRKIMAAGNLACRPSAGQINEVLKAIGLTGE